MPFRQRGSYGRNRGSRLGSVIDSNKNIVSLFTGAATGANTIVPLITTVDAAANTSVTEVTRGCKIFKLWLELLIYASAAVAVGVTSGFDCYLIKNPGANLTPPSPGAVGSSNEKKFVFKSWKGIVGTRTEGSPPYSWKGWIKIPRVYQRMGADDLIQLVIRPTGAAMLVCSDTIYKWYK